MEESVELKGNIFDIQGLSIHDGPGCRTVIFMKGCPLNCEWCSNPEGIKPYTEPMYYADKCIKDGNCVDACKQNAILINPEGKLIIQREKCRSCITYDCIDACLTGALKKSSSLIHMNEVLRIIQRDRQFWGASGGLTISGGEPLYQFPFAFELLKRAHDSYVHTAIETCGHISWEKYEKVIPFLDWIFFDLKQINPMKHFEKTGQTNEMILDNARKLALNFKGRLVFRTPVIPGFNDDEKSINELINFVEETGRKEINLLPLHLFGKQKYDLLGYETFPLIDSKIPDNESLNKIAKQFENSGIKTYVGSETDF